jgi:hypothetical protein
LFVTVSHRAANWAAVLAANLIPGVSTAVMEWGDNRDVLGTYQGQYAPLAIDGDLAVAMGRSKYFDASGVLLREFDNCFVIRFDEQGRCTSFMSPWSTLKTTSS